MKRLFLLAAIFMALTSCVKNQGIEGTDAVLDGFNWKTTHAVSISVATPTVDAAYQKYATTIRVYTKPLYTSKYLVGEGAAYTGKPYTATIDLPTALDTLYVWAKVPTGAVSLYKYIVGATKAVNNASAFKSPKAAYSSYTGPSLPTPISVPTSYTGTITSAYSISSVCAVGNWLIKGPMTIGSDDASYIKNNWVNGSTLYISGNVTFSSAVNVSLFRIVVLPGATLTFSGLAYFTDYYGGKTMLEVKEGGTVNFNGGFYFSSPVDDVVNYGTINIGKSSTYAEVYNTIFYNASSGTINAAKGSGDFSLDSYGTLYNFGTANLRGVDASSSLSLIENEAGANLECSGMNLSAATCNNYGYYTCSGTVNQAYFSLVDNYGSFATSKLCINSSYIDCNAGSLLSVGQFIKSTNSLITTEPQSIVVVDNCSNFGSMTNLKFYNPTYGTDTEDYALVILGMKLASDGTLEETTGKLSASVNVNNVDFTGPVEVYYPNAKNGAESLKWTETLCNNANTNVIPAYFGYGEDGPERINDIPETPYNHGIGNKGGKDNDGDGVPDDTDQFPNDPTLAYVSYFPSEGTFCTYAFEDLWSDIGDYDLNDLVIYCNVGYYKNANNMVVYEKVKWKLMAAGTSMLLSCGVQLDGVSTSEVSSVTNTNTALAAGPIGHSESNGCESGQTYAVFPLLNSPSELFGVNTFVNTGYTGGSVVAPVEKETKVTFTTPLDPTRLGMDAFNLFIAVSKNFDATYRGREVHLMTFDATDLIDPNLLKYDPTNPQDWKSDDNPYRLRNGLVWAIMIPTEFHWARETIDVASIYTNYINWYSTSAADAQYWYDTSVSTNVSNYNWLYN
ncbi:MAG: LruC domain-containing protein [Bacteroidales bacterium]|jgi:LruC domain-containing protein|nr:LruC domain-containing protein [Bacteroidales bacterium]